jgi:glycosyltransferase involved in cell wall biosynthesis
MLTIIFDGWPLIYKPNSPESLHLLDLLAHSPQGVNPVAAIPAKPPVWFPEKIETAVHPTLDKPWNRLVWEQKVIPGVFRRRRADLIHLTRPTVPLSHASSTVVSPAGIPRQRSGGTIRKRAGGVWERLRAAAATAAAAQAGGFLWPEDLVAPAGSTTKKPILLPPLFSTDLTLFNNSEKANNLPELPETFILYHGPEEKDDLLQLFNGWSWAAGSIGDYYPLLILGLSNQGNLTLLELLKEYQLTDSIRTLSEVPPRQIPLIYERSSALFHPAPGTPWGGPLRMGLAMHIPIAASDEGFNSEIVEKAAYLTPPGDYRGMGAAIISIIIEESIADRLSTAARNRVESWSPENFKREIMAAYRQILNTT